MNNIFNSPIPLPNFTMTTDEDFTNAVGAVSRSIAGFSCSISGFTVRRQNGIASINPLTANLNLPGFSQTFSGSITSDGTVSLDYLGMAVA